MMRDAHWTDRLSEYLDGELTAAERVKAERHLAACGECAGLLEELRAVASAARSLADSPPRRDLWPGIQARLAPRSAAGGVAAAGPGLEGAATVRAPGDTGVATGRDPVGSMPGPRDRSWAGRVVDLASRRRLTLTVPQLLAAGIAVAVLSAGGVWVALGGGAAGPAGGGGLAGGGGVAEGAVPEATLAAFEPAMADLESEYALRRAELEPETIRVVERNLAIIDAAIEDARRALAADPSSGFLQGHLADAVRMRMSLLRQVSSI